MGHRARRQQNPLAISPGRRQGGWVSIESPSPTPAPASPPATAQTSAMSEREFVVLMAMTQALQALAMDIMLPALGAMSSDLGATTANQRQLVIGVFLMGSALGSLFPGPLADRFGRRRVLLCYLAAYVVQGAACALVGHFSTLIALRFTLGLSSAGLMVLPAAIIRDRVSGDRMARLQSMVMMVFMVVPMMAPSLGQAVQLLAGWRWIFGVMALFGAVVGLWTALRLPETLRPEYRQAFHPATIVRSLGAVVTHRTAIGYVFGFALMQAALYGWLNSSQQLVAEHFGAGRLFPTIFGGMALVMASTNFVNSRVVMHFGARAVSHGALLAYIAVGLVQLGLALSGRETLWSFIPVMTLTMCLMSFVSANFASIALQPFARNAGSAASAQVFVRMVIGSTLGAMVGAAYDGTARPMATAYVIAGVSVLALVLISERGRLFHAKVETATPVA